METALPSFSDPEKHLYKIATCKILWYLESNLQRRIFLFLFSIVISLHFEVKVHPNFCNSIFSSQNLEISQSFLEPSQVQIASCSDKQTKMGFQYNFVLKVATTPEDDRPQKQIKQKSLNLNTITSSSEYLQQQPSDVDANLCDDHLLLQLKAAIKRESTSSLYFLTEIILQIVELEEFYMSQIHETSCLTATSKSQLNNSSAKACYSFSKNPRQPLHSKPNDLIYELPSMLSKRSTSIGFGKKSTLMGPNFSPSPDRYNKPSDFEKSPQKGKSFGLSRQNIKAVSIFNQNKYPGPGEYEAKVSEIKESPKNYSIRTRDGFPQIFQSTHNPGPGHYQIKQDTQKQFFYNSRRKSPQIYTIQKANKENLKKLSPIGPTSYQISFPSMGPQILAKRKTQQSFFFPKQIRETLKTVPSNVGPGSYHHFSEFGK